MIILLITCLCVPLVFAADMLPPVASFTSNVTSGTAPLAVGFTDTSTNSPDAWNWSLNNVTGNNTAIWWSTLQNPEISLGVGNWSFALNASNAYGYNITPGDYWVNVSTSGVAPVAEFSEEKSGSICLGESIQFTDESINTPTTWLWEFEDGGSSIDQNPDYTFNIEGTFDVNFKASNTYGFSWRNKTDLMVVNNCTTPVPTPIPIANPIRQNRGQLIDLITWILNLFRSKLV